MIVDPPLTMKMKKTRLLAFSMESTKVYHHLLSLSITTKLLSIKILEFYLAKQSLSCLMMGNIMSVQFITFQRIIKKEISNIF